MQVEFLNPTFRLKGAVEYEYPIYSFQMTYTPKHTPLLATQLRQTLQSLLAGGDLPAGVIGKTG